ncbi:MAG TPA: glycosyltransferase [Xanthomonadaceae bacterium]|nr:glycosyltransferase [Xanthomonadaceae bacterium]
MNTDVAAKPSALSRLSVIIPLAPDETAHLGLLQQLAALPAGAEIHLAACGDVEIPVDLRDALRHLRCEIGHHPQGRARQLNHGIRDTHQPWLWLLHADSRLQPDTLPALERFLAAGSERLGWFDLAFADDGPWLARLNAWGANRRSRWFGLPFGDQGLVLPRTTFEALGGFDESATYGEDHLLVWAAHIAGIAVVPVGAGLVSSARNYAERGWLRTTLRHWRLTLAQAWPQWRAWRRSRSRRSSPPR